MSGKIDYNIFFSLREGAKNNPTKAIIDFALKKSKKVTNGTRINTDLLRDYKSMIPENEQNIILEKKVCEILNTLAEKNLESVSSKILSIDFSNEKQLKILVNTIMDKVVLEPLFVGTFSRFCSLIKKLRVKNGDKKNNKHQFLFVLLVEAKKYFTNEIENYEDDGKKKSVDEEKKIKDPKLTFVKFLAELCKNKMLLTNIIDECIILLFEKNTNFSLECICNFLSVLKNEYRNREDETYKIMYGKLKDITKDKKYELRIRSMIGDLLDKDLLSDRQMKEIEENDD